MNNKIVEDFRKMVDINRPIIYIHNFDFTRIDDIVKQAIDKASVIEWNPATGTTNFDTRLEKGFGKDQPLVDFLHNEYTQEIEDGKPVNQKFIVLREIQDLIDDPAVKTLLAFMSQRKLYDYKYEKTIVIISSVNKVPEELKQYISYLDIPLPDNNEINNLIDFKKDSANGRFIAAPYFKYSPVEDATLKAGVQVETKWGEASQVDFSVPVKIEVKF